MLAVGPDPDTESPYQTGQCRVSIDIDISVSAPVSCVVKYLFLRISE